MVCLLAAPWVQLSVSAGNGWPHNVLRLHWLMPISCHFRDCKALVVTSLTHVSGAIARLSVQTFTFTYPRSGRLPRSCSVPRLSLERVKVDISNLVCMWIVASTSERNINCHLRGRGQGDVTHWEVKNQWLGRAEIVFGPNLIANRPIYYKKRPKYSLPVSLSFRYILVKVTEQLDQGQGHARKWRNRFSAVTWRYIWFDLL